MSSASVLRILNDQNSLLTSVGEVVVSGASVGVLPGSIELQQKTLVTRFGVVQKRVQFLPRISRRREIVEKSGKGFQKKVDQLRIDR